MFCTQCVVSLEVCLNSKMARVSLLKRSSMDLKCSSVWILWILWIHSICDHFFFLRKRREFQIRCLYSSATPNQSVVLVYWTYHANWIPNDKMIQNVQPTILLDRHIKMHSNDIFIFLVSNDFSFRSLGARVCVCHPQSMSFVLARFLLLDALLSIRAQISISRMKAKDANSSFHQDAWKWKRKLLSKLHRLKRGWTNELHPFICV